MAHPERVVDEAAELKLADGVDHIEVAEGFGQAGDRSQVITIVMRDARCVMYRVDVRTTLNVDDDVLAAARQRARRDRVSVGEALSALARQGLGNGTPRSRKSRSRNGIPLLGSSGKEVGPELVDEILDEIS